MSIGQLCDDGCSIVFNERNLVAIKNNKVILQGTRNYSDGLWDIPIHKKHITCDNYPSLNIHPGIYPSKITPASKSTISLPIIAKKTHDSRLPHHLRNFDQLIQDNINYINIDKQINQDRQQNTKIRIHPNNPSMAVIIHKKTDPCKIG